jgi:hypothetical protein
MYTPVSKRNDITDEDAEKFAEHDITPPRGNFVETRYHEVVKHIVEDFGRKAWRRGCDAHGPIFDTESRRKSAVFLYSRLLHEHDKLNKTERKQLVRDFLTNEKLANRLAQLLESSGDRNLALPETYKEQIKIPKAGKELSLEEKAQAERAEAEAQTISERKADEARSQHLLARLMIHRIFKLKKAHGFLPDMSKFVLFSRDHDTKICFEVGPTTATACRLQTFGTEFITGPVDLAKFFRHNFSIPQIIEYVRDDSGGDSKVMYEILDRAFFNCSKENREGNNIKASLLIGEDSHVHEEAVKSVVKKEPGLISRFEVHKTFSEYPSRYQGGVWLYKTWGEPPIFINFPRPKDDASAMAEEKALKEEIRRHLDTNGKEWHKPSRDGSDPVSDNEQLVAEICRSHETHAQTPSEKQQTRLDSEIAQISYHAMVLLGHFEVTDDVPDELRIVCEIGDLLWVLQNTWARSRPVILMTSGYLAGSNATISFFGKSDRTPKRNPDVEVNTAPIAEACTPAKSDSASWVRHFNEPREISPDPNRPRWLL